MKNSIKLKGNAGFKKVILISVCLFTSLQLAYSADYYKAKLFYANGNIIEGLAQIPAASTVKAILYKPDDNSKKQQINSTDLTKVIFYGEGDSMIIEQISAKNILNETKINQAIWMIKMIDGYASLYFFTEGGGMSYYNHNARINMPGMIKYACIRKGEQAATIISFHAPKGVNSFNNNNLFKKNGANYFSDYPELSAKIANKEYTYMDIDKVMDEYNKWVQKEK
jgi:hypothetical protein